ncbi:cupin domain-containing protein [Aliiglaciecola sp. 2_MG-2023]|uniref:cupin domain-containing protein n=1 Tax=unclassified Aliiglaciecola TaxID=2593648 RepID=UPI0026E48EE3|nr:MULTISPECIES: cupin domain-containing protein [unclassified Aliiglaciecola]MDO6711129.1 cupin domain-containing protein [Aliiglaciecola sp. 2_MG-2023]MDO6752043.1 cupin domain-containing protein [Aliiglaciecola sp. 1_MG-2023]
MQTKTLFETFAVIKPDLSVTTKNLSDSIYQELDDEFSSFKGHSLVSAHEFNENWQSWEKHPAGDEIVILLSGQCELIIRFDKKQQQRVLSQQGDYVVIPKNHWHTARISTPTRVLFITPGQGTQNTTTPF